MTNNGNNPKQIAVAGVLGVVLLASVGHAVFQVQAAQSAPVKAPAGTDVSAPPSANPATPAGTTGAPADGASGSAASDLALVSPLQPVELRNPFQAPTEFTNPGPPPASLPGQPVPSVASKAPAKGGPAAPRHSSVAAASIPSPAPVRSFYGSRPQYAPQYTQPNPLIRTYTAPVQTTSVPQTIVRPVAPPPPTVEQVFEADTAALKSSVTVRGVLVGSPSAAFITIDGKQQVVHAGDQLPDGFQVASISDQGIEVFYSKTPTLNKSFPLAL